MMRGAELIFAAIFSVLFLGKRLNKLHGLGILMTVIGISMVGSASLMAPNQNATGTKAQQVTGIVLIILSQAVQVCVYHTIYMNANDILSKQPRLGRFASRSSLWEI